MMMLKHRWFQSCKETVEQKGFTSLVQRIAGSIPGTGTPVGIRFNEDARNSLNTSRPGRLQIIAP
ncbi:MAG: hypothetical protein JNM68_15010 [Dinghuibacter sp.]|nr:hypothetical protein [Dinghuibacter sp.]